MFVEIKSGSKTPFGCRNRLMPVDLDFSTGKNFFGDLNFQIIEANQFLEAFASNLRLNAPARVAKGK